MSNNAIASIALAGDAESSSCSSDKPQRSRTWGMISAMWWRPVGRVGEWGESMNVNDICDEVISNLQGVKWIQVSAHSRAVHII